MIRGNHTVGCCLKAFTRVLTVDFTWLEYLLWLPRNAGMLLDASHTGFGNPEAGYPQRTDQLHGLMLECLLQDSFWS